MEKGFLHLHVTVVLLFMLLLAFKVILLLANNTTLLEKVRSKTKVADMVLGTLILITGGYLLSIAPQIDTYLIGKIIIVLLAIPMGIIGLKKGNKVLASLSILTFIYIYGVAETKSLKFKRDKFELPQTGETNTIPNDSTANTTDANSPAIIDQNQNSVVANGKAFYEHLCVTCHGIDGKLGLGGAKDLSKTSLSHEEKVLMITKGKGLMQGFKDILSEQEIEAVTAYVETLKK